MNLDLGPEAASRERECGEDTRSRAGSCDRLTSDPHVQGGQGLGANCWLVSRSDREMPPETFLSARAACISPCDGRRGDAILASSLSCLLEPRLGPHSEGETCSQISQTEPAGHSDLPSLSFGHF